MENLSPENKKKVLEAVKKQVDENEPEATGMTFEKLVKMASRRKRPTRSWERLLSAKCAR